MDLESKIAILGVLQTRMDKCTSEQFWAVGSVTALNAFLVSERSGSLQAMPSVVAMALSAAMGLYAVAYVVHRHTAFYRLFNAAVSIFKDCPGSPLMLRNEDRPWSGASLSGVTFYVVWIAMTTFAVFVSCR